MFNTIVVPLDGSPAAEEVLPHVKRILRQVDAELILVRTANPAVVGVPPAVFDVTVGEARRYLAGLTQQFEAQGSRVRFKVELGPTSNEILRVAQEERASLIAMTTHGRSGPGRFFLGSVAEDVLRRSLVPVLAVRAPAPTPPPSEYPDPLRKVLVPIDGSDRALHAFVPAAEMCRLFKARLVFLRVLENDDSEERARAKAQLGEIEERGRAIGIDSVSFLAEGEAAPRILDMARFHKADLIAMATHGRRGMPRLLMGSVTEAVLRRSSQPVLVVRSNEVSEGRGREHLAGSRA